MAILDNRIITNDPGYKKIVIKKITDKAEPTLETKTHVIPKKTKNKRLSPFSKKALQIIVAGKVNMLVKIIVLAKLDEISGNHLIKAKSVM